MPSPKRVPAEMADTRIEDDGELVQPKIVPDNDNDNEIRASESLATSANNTLEDIQQELQDYMEADDEDRKEEEEEEEEDDDDEFDDFNEANDDVESDFGSFDETSFDNDKEFVTKGLSSRSAGFDESAFEDASLFEERLGEVLDTIFPQAATHEQTISSSNTFLSERSLEIFTELATLPRLKPPNWIKSKIRHNLLIKLGIPINLDEIASEKHEIDRVYSSESKQGHQRKKSIQAGEIQWGDFEIPEFESLNISSEGKAKLLSETSQTLSRIETDNLNNSSSQYLENSASDEVLDAKLKQFQSNYEELLVLSSIWNNHLKNLRHNFEIYESVVQNFTGYSQKLRREEILENLKKVKHKGKKSKRLW